MEVILLEKVHKLGNLGDTVNVKPGYGRNFLIPQGVAISSTKANKEKFEVRRAELEEKAGDILAMARTRAAKFQEVGTITIAENASDEGKLYGSVTTAEIAHALAEKGVEVERKEISLPESIRELGEFSIDIHLHSDVTTTIKLEVVAKEK